MSKGGDPAANGAEIDIFEYHRRTPGIIYHTVHWGGYGDGHRQEGTEIPVRGIDTGFHTFGLEWTPAEYIFYVDGWETSRTSTAVSRRPQYMILSTELTGWGGDPAQSIFPDAVLFDYVRVFKRINGDPRMQAAFYSILPSRNLGIKDGLGSGSFLSSTFQSGGLTPSR
jgi:beta-glucanase (GH16 family)